MDWTQILLDSGIDVPVDRDEFQILCPFHEDTVRSCSINVSKGVWICFAGCGAGSLKYFLKQYLDINDFQVSDLLYEKEIEYNLNMFDHVLVPQGTNGIPQLAEMKLDYKRGIVPNWIFQRDFTSDTLQKWKCGTNRYHDLVIPINDKEDKVVGSVIRRQNVTPKYLYSEGLKKSQVLFGANKVIDKCPFVCITEGPLDTMWLWQHGFNSVAILGIYLSLIQQKILKTLPTEELVICLDNDNAGKKGAENIWSDLSTNFIVSYIKIPRGYKDVQDIRDKNMLCDIIQARNYW